MEVKMKKTFCQGDYDILLELHSKIWQNAAHMVFFLFFTLDPKTKEQIKFIKQENHFDF